ncbi:MAG: transcription antitermination factor NusB [Flavobacteriaceae bacterium]|nr:transcription antitermination factor NusB [Flavobacteriaceae bacterium]
MINRRHLRIKVMQILYSQYAANSKYKELLKILEERSLKFYLFFITYLLLFRDLKTEFSVKEKIVSKKNFNNNSKLIRHLVLKNQFLSFLSKSKTLEKIKIKYNIRIWDENHHLIERLFKKILESKFFNEFSNKENSIEEQRVFVITIFKKYIINDDSIYQFFEDTELGWVDDFPLINSLFLNYLKSFTFTKADKIPIKVYGDKEDKEYANKLFKIVLENEDELNTLIEKFTPDWENERIANLDLITIKMCICEFMYFPSIPVRVSMNEYVEISKDYSSPESGKFINGVVNNILKDLTNKNLVEKNERGSQ